MLFSFYAFSGVPVFATGFLFALFRTDSVSRLIDLFWVVLGSDTRFALVFHKLIHLPFTGFATKVLRVLDDRVRNIWLRFEHLLDIVLIIEISRSNKVIEELLLIFQAGLLSECRFQVLSLHPVVLDEPFFFFLGILECRLDAVVAPCDVL